MMKSTNITWKSNDPHPETTILTWFLRYHLEVYIYIWHIYSDILSDILSGIYFDILSDIPPGIYSDILSGIYSNIIASGILSGIYSDTLSRILSDILSGVWLRSGSAQWDLALAAEVQCPLRSGARGWGPAVLLRSGARGWGPAVPTAVCSARLRIWRTRRRRKRRWTGRTLEKI